MNHWISRYQDDKEICSACGEKVPNSSDRGGVQITGRCAGVQSRKPAAVEGEGEVNYISVQPLGEGQVMICSKCVAKPPFSGKYRLVELPLPHDGFCQQCRAFVGDGYYVVDLDPPGGIQVTLSSKTRGDLWGIWCTHDSLPPRWIAHEDPLLDMPKPFGTQEDALAAVARGFEAPWFSGGWDGWTFTPKRLREGT
jgi:hypothetical protein